MIRRTAAALLALSVIAVAPVMAELKVGVVNPAKILNEIKETKAAQDAFLAKQKTLNDQAAAKKAEVEAKLKDIATSKGTLKPESQQFADLSKQELQLATELQIWAKLAEIDLVRDFRNQAQGIGEKIKGAIQNVAKAKGLDLVLADQADPQPAELDRVPPQNLLPVLLNKAVFYRADNLDITQEVIALLDKGFGTK